jgi:hypothetical protein
MAVSTAGCLAQATGDSAGTWQQRRPITNPMLLYVHLLAQLRPPPAQRRTNGCCLENRPLGELRRVTGGTARSNMVHRRSTCEATPPCQSPLRLDIPGFANRNPTRWRSSVRVAGATWWGRLPSVRRPSERIGEDPESSPCAPPPERSIASFAVRVERGRESSRGTKLAVLWRGTRFGT